MATIKDVAARSGVSIKTVSRVMNNPDAVTAATRDRVLEAVRALDFVPDRRASAMRSGRSGVIGFLSDGVATTPFSVDLIRGAQDALAESGMTMLLANADGGHFRDHLRDFQGFRVDGLILATGYHRAAEDLPQPAAKTVLVNCFDPQARFPAVLPNDTGAGLTATRHLLARGHRRIGFVTLPADIAASRQRLDGFRRAHAEHGVAVDDGLIREGVVWAPGGQRMIAYDVALDLLRRPDRPDAVLCGNDVVAMQVYNAARTAGIAVPDGLSIVGIDDNVVVATGLRPALTTVALPYAAMGRKAVDLLLGPETGLPAETIWIDCPLVERDSCPDRAVTTQEPEQEGKTPAPA